MEYFGKLPGFNFTKISEMSPGSPKGRRKFSSDDDVPLVSRKRTSRSESGSRPCPDASKLRIDDISHDEAWDGF